MGVSSGKSVYARHGNGPDRRNDPRTAPPVLRTCGRIRLRAGLIFLLLLASPATAGETIRIASFNVGLDRDGPGLLYRDILRGEDTQIAAIIDVITAVSPDILVLQKFDYDHDLLALKAFAAQLKQDGPDYPHFFATLPNSGMFTGLDMDGDGYLGDPSDAQGFGSFAGSGGLAILSRFPIAQADVKDFSAFLWADLPGAIPPHTDDGVFPSDAAFAIQRLSTTSHLDVPVLLPDGGRLLLWTMYATPPVFDGPEDRNGRRNHDETLFWLKYANGELPWQPDDFPFVLLGGLNLDPVDGAGRSDALLRLLSDPRVQDVQPASSAGRQVSEQQGGVNNTHRGDPALDTADWPDQPGRPGNMRVDYVLPSNDLTVINSGVHWPADGTADAASTHRLVWVDIAF